MDSGLIDRQMDHDNDHKLNQIEFKSGAYNSYKRYVEFEGHLKKVPPADDVFARLDLNHDKFVPLTLFSYDQLIQN